MSNFVIVNLLKLSELQKQAIIKIFEGIKDEELPSFLEQLKQRHPIRKRIDILLLEIIGFEKDQIEEILVHLYLILANEIEKLKTLMKG